MLILRLSLTMKKSKPSDRKFILLFIRGFLFLLSFLLVLLANSALWMHKHFGGMDFRSAVFQLSTPMAGTGHEMVSAYLTGCLLKTVVEVCLFAIVVTVINKVFSYESLIWNITIFRFKKKLVLKLKKSTFRTVFAWILLIVFLCVWCYKSLLLIKVDKYFEAQRNDNKYLENNFVDPRDVKIEFPEKKRNLLFIYMESMEATYASVEDGGGKSTNYIPYLTNLARENICFSNTSNSFGGYNWYGPTGWTLAALIGSTSGAPYLIPVIEDSQYTELLPKLYTLGDILEKEGYRNYFMCGSDSSFGARKAYYQSHGNYSVFDYYTAIEDGIVPADYYAFWGIEDKYLYQYAKDKLTELSNDTQPFNFTMLTVDTHHMDGYVCDLCKNEYDSQYGNVIACADRQIEDFLDWVFEQEWYENTTIIIVGDHNSMNNNFWDDLPQDYSRSIYNCFINVSENAKTDNTTNRDMVSLDLFPTTLATLGANIEGDRLGLGTNMFSNTQTLEERDGVKTFTEQSGSYSKYFEENYILN